MSSEVDLPFIGSRVVSFSLRMAWSAVSISLAICSHLIFVWVRIPSGVMPINFINNKRHFVVAEEVRDRCVVASAATAIWRNVCCGFEAVCDWSEWKLPLRGQITYRHCLQPDFF